MGEVREELHRVIGIDLGTTYSAVASFNNHEDTAEILKNKDVTDPRKQPTTPSVIGLDPRTRKVIVGWPAKNNIMIDPQNTIIEVKREMGESFTPATLHKFQAQGVFREDQPVQVKFDGTWYRPQEISSFTLMKMKEVAEREIGTEIRDAVITVPAYFTARQRKATQEAALLAGLYPRQIIPEPTAAAICYGVDRGETARKVYLVYDLGGGTFDVSVIVVENQIIEVIATEGNARLGGGDFDDVITAWAIEELAKPPYSVSIATKPHLREIIKARAEDAKKQVSTYMDTKMELVELMAEFNLATPPILTLTRQKFEELISRYLNDTITVVNKAIEKAKTRDSSLRIDAILLVGGSSRIPCIRQQLLDYFQASENFLRSDVQPDEVVARGAAILAKRFEVSPPPFDINHKFETAAALTNSDEDYEVHFIAEHSLGIGALDENEQLVMNTLIQAGSRIPTSETRGGYKNSGRSEYIPVQIYQGDKKFIHQNTLIGVLQIGPMTPMDPGQHQFEVTFSLDRDGLLSTQVRHINENRTYEGSFASAGGIEEDLQKTREKILRLYKFPRPEEEYKGPPKRSEDIVPPPAPSSLEDIVPPPAPSSLEDIVPPPAPDEEVIVTSTAAEDMPSAATDNTPPSIDSALDTTEADAGQIEILVEVPEKFSSVLRRTRKILIKEDVPELLAAYNKVVQALNDGAEPSELEELSDELEDIYHDTRAKFA